tara:strand:+ start:40687 stop:40893 length:207 start_codon:yes stop_codon:yes gene_type:complete
MNIFLEVDNFDGLFIFLITIMVVPAILLFIIAIILGVKNKKKAAKIFWILAVVYLIISFGFCGILMIN